MYIIYSTCAGLSHLVGFWLVRVAMPHSQDFTLCYLFLSLPLLLSCLSSYFSVVSNTSVTRHYLSCCLSMQTVSPCLSLLSLSKYVGLWLPLSPSHTALNPHLSSSVSQLYVCACFSLSWSVSLTHLTCSQSPLPPISIFSQLNALPFLWHPR